MSHNPNPPTPPDDLRQQLGYLKLPFMQQHCDELAKQAAAEQWSHVEFLRRLVEGEAAAHQDRARQRRIQQARFPVLKTFEQFDFTWPTKINRLAVQNLFRLKFIEEKANAVFVGTVGLGKSHLSVALGYAAAVAGFRVRFTSFRSSANATSAARLS
jgi:DNA replication protein DnaC